MQANERITVELLTDWLRHRAHRLYGGESVTQLQHALQCATLAQAEGATPELTIAALLHDIGHVADTSDDCEHPHGEVAAHLLKDLFSPAVTEPIRMHVDAKRYLCTNDKSYWDQLSPASKRSLEWQGGPFSPGDAERFIAQYFAPDAVRLRRWDDAAKDPAAVTPTLDYFVSIMKTMVRPAAQAVAI